MVGKPAKAQLDRNVSAHRHKTLRRSILCPCIQTAMPQAQAARYSQSSSLSMPAADLPAAVAATALRVSWSSLALF
eukprot:scaffold102281_cov13-Tisochrysis_lutea.AAC.1